MFIEKISDEQILAFIDNDINRICECNELRPNKRKDANDKAIDLMGGLLFKDFSRDHKFCIYGLEGVKRTQNYEGAYVIGYANRDEGALANCFSPFPTKLTQGSFMYSFSDFDCAKRGNLPPDNQKNLLKDSWVKYMFSIFGKEYEDAYVQYVIKNAESLFQEDSQEPADM